MKEFSLLENGNWEYGNKEYRICSFYYTDLKYVLVKLSLSPNYMTFLNVIIGKLDADNNLVVNEFGAEITRTEDFLEYAQTQAFGKIIEASVHPDKNLFIHL